MTEPTYASIEPLIASQNVQAGSVEVTFRCPKTGLEVAATGRLTKAAGVTADAARTAKKGM